MYCVYLYLLYTLYIAIHKHIYSTLYTVQCTLYSVHCTVYTVQCTLYKWLCTMHMAHVVYLSVSYIPYITKRNHGLVLYNKDTSIN